MKKVKYWLIPVVCLILCVMMTLPACAFTSDESATPIESFFEGLFMMLFVIVAALIPFAIPILIVLAVIAVGVFFIVFAIIRKRKKSSRETQTN